jgi:putative endonuclease
MMHDHKTLNRNELGRTGEALVADKLVNDGYHIDAINFRQRYGEIDIIAHKENLIIFVEVKLRQTHYFNLSEVVTRSKQLKIIKTAKYYLAMHHYRQADFVCRFDIACVEQINGVYEIHYIPNAFQESSW